MTEGLPVFNIERFAIHDGAGIRTAVFLQGCRLRCPWCANPESQTVGLKLMFLQKKCVGCRTCAAVCPQGAAAISEGRAVIDRSRCVRCGTCAAACPAGALQISGKWMTAEEIFDVVIRDQAYYQQTHGGLTLSGGEALLWIDQLMPLLKKCKEANIPVDFETCGHVPAGNIRKAIPRTDTFLFDIKSMNPEAFHSVTGGDLFLVLANFQEIAKEHPEKLVIRVPVIPGFNHTPEDMENIFALAKKYAVRQVDLLPYHTFGLTKYLQLGETCPWPAEKSLAPAELDAYQARGQEMGLIVTIGG